MSETEMSQEQLIKMIKTNKKLYYPYPELNDILYLHYKSLNISPDLKLFNNLKTLYLEGNSLTNIDSLPLPKLQCLYLQQNLFKSVPKCLQELSVIILDLSDNQIETIDNIPNCIQNLSLKRNKIKQIYDDNDIDQTQLVVDNNNQNGIVRSIVRCGQNGNCRLQEYKYLESLDLSSNPMKDPLNIGYLVSLDSLLTLYVSDCPFVSSIRYFRKQMIHNMSGLKYLMDRPIDQSERQCVQAYFKGGLESERKQKQQIKESIQLRHKTERQQLDQYLIQLQQQSMSNTNTISSETESNTNKDNTYTTYYSNSNQQSQPQSTDQSELQQSDQDQSDSYSQQQQDHSDHDQIDNHYDELE